MPTTENARVTLLTCTNDRPVAFRACEHWINKQVCDYDLRWVVIDDGIEPAPCTLGQEHVRLPHIEGGEQSWLRNMSTGLDLTSQDQFVLNIEDDNWYSSSYVAAMLGLLRSPSNPVIAGFPLARYYNLRQRVYRTLKNTQNCGFGSTGWRPELVQVIRDNLNRWNFDLHVWRTPGLQREFYRDARHVVGLKSFPGKVGLGMGHRDDMPGEFDESGAMLRQWLGHQDAEYLLELLHGAQRAA